MNTSGLLQETLSIHDSMNLPKIKFIFLKCQYSFYGPEDSFFFPAVFTLFKTSKPQNNFGKS